MTSFIAELRRRNVLRVAAAYAVVAWIIIEAGSVLLPTFGASETTFQIYVVVVIVGFLASLVFAWVFELTPEGVKLEKNVDRSASVVDRTGRKLDFAIIGLLIIALAVSITLNVTGFRVLESGNSTSIAVLPFKSISEDATNVNFADGIHDDLLTRLANIGALKVISRTSVMEYRGTTKNIRQIADELGVGTVVEGSVQRVGNNVRINAQLIDAATDEHLWAKTYDRELNMQNIFAIQSDISGEIATALQATLSPEEQSRLANVPTQNMEAYNLYVLGRANLYKRRLETLLEAREQFVQAVEIDPEYAEAYAGLADSVLLLFNNHAALTRDETLSVAGASIGTALLLNPELADAYASLGLLQQKIWEETRTGPGLLSAETALKRAIELNPNHARAYMWLAAVRSTESKFDEAIDLYHESLRVDPLGRIPYANLPGLYAQKGDNEQALKLFLKAVELHPEWPTAYLNLAVHLQGLGRFDEAIAWSRRGRELSTDPLAGGNITASWVEFGEFQRIRRLFSDVPEQHPLFDLGAGLDRVLDGDFAAAAAAFEAVADQSDNPRQFMLDLVSTSAILAGDFDTARRFAERRNPEFAADADPEVDLFNVANAVRYAFILQQFGESRRANYLLDAALTVVRGLPRMGIAGHGIRDVHILTLQGKPLEALEAFRDAVDAGFRGSTMNNGWPLALDPYLASLQDRAEFRAIKAEIDTDIERMRENILRAERDDDWAALRAVAGST
ncbi:MAG: tetratricopeptide repeat protein [Gammaproteobacteria bacterium]|nr:tetratricopeptide repeat protein [Gammaproteobacteria bacterium]